MKLLFLLPAFFFLLSSPLSLESCRKPFLTRLILLFLRRMSATPFLQNGYAHVNTDVRGSGKSGGALCLLCKREQEDVYDVVEWIAKQPWSDGNVALSGYSYSAIT